MALWLSKPYVQGNEIPIAPTKFSLSCKWRDLYVSVHKVGPYQL